MGGLRVFTLMAVGVAMSGCLLSPFDQEVRQAQTHLDTLTARVGQLEQERLGGEAAATTLAATNAAVSPSAVTVVSEGAAPATAAIPAPTTSSEASRFPWMSMDLRKALSKLVRGVTNILTGWVEIPKRVHETTDTSGAGAGFTWGFLRGFGYGFIRTAGGAYETVTFPFPAPPNYQPVMQPPYVFLCDNANLASSSQP